MKVERATDEEVLAASRENPVYFNILVRRYRARFIRATARIVVVEADAEDVVQEALVKMWRNAAMYRRLDGIALKSWAYKIVLNQAYSWRRQERYAYMGISFDDALSVDLVDPHDFQEKVRARIWMRRLIDLLPPKYREVVMLYYFEEETYRTIAENLGITMETLKMRLFRAREMLKHMAATYTPEHVKVTDCLRDEISILCLPSPIEHTLRRERGVRLVGDLAMLSRDRLIMTRDIDISALYIIENTLRKVGLRLTG